MAGSGIGGAGRWVSTEASRPDAFPARCGAGLADGVRRATPRRGVRADFRERRQPTRHRQSFSYGEMRPTKTRRRRTVDIIAPLRDDLDALLDVTPTGHSLVAPSRRGNADRPTRVAAPRLEDRCGARRRRGWAVRSQALLLLDAGP